MPKEEPARALARSAASRSWRARLAGFPDLPFLRFFGGACIRPRDFLPAPGMPPMPGIPGAPGIPGIPGAPPRAMDRIIVLAWSNRCTIWLTSVTVVPEPLAIRARPEPLRSWGLARAAGVSDRQIAPPRAT